MMSPLMLAALGLATIVVLVTLILTKRTTPLVALVVVPLLAGLAAGHSSSLGGFVTSGIQQTAPVAATFVFAILYFGVMADAGTLDPFVDRLLATIGSHPVRITIGTAVFAMLAHLDGSGAVTFLMVIPPLLPIYTRLGMDRRVLAAVVAMAAGVMNMLPWGGPLIRAAASLKIPVADLFIPLVPVLLVGLAFVLGSAYWLGRREALRLRMERPDADHSTTSVVARTLSDEARALRRPRMLWPNVILTVLVLTSMVTGWVPTALAFMIGAVVALTINYPKPADQRVRVDAHAKAAILMATILIAAGAFTGIMNGTGMLRALAASVAGLLSPETAAHLPVVLGVLSVPLSLAFDPDSFYFGMLPVIAEVAGQHGVASVQVAQGALLGQMTTGFPVSPLTPSTFLLVGLAGVDLAEHQRFTIPWLIAASVVMTIAAVLMGVLTL